MWNPFKAIGNAGKAIGGAIGNAGKATGRAIAGAGKAVASTPGAIVRAVKAPFSKKEKAPTPRPAPTRPATTRPPAPPREATRVMPTVKPSAPPATGKKLPRSMIQGPSTGGAAGGTGGGFLGMARDDAILGEDSDIKRALLEAIKEFESENSLSGLNQKAMDFIAHPSYSAIFDKYATGGGFSTEQWIAGMSNPDNFRMTRVGDKIHIIFDGDFIIDGEYDLGGRSPYATF